MGQCWAKFEDPSPPTSADITVSFPINAINAHSYPIHFSLIVSYVANKLV